MKSATVVDRSDEIDELKQKLEKLTATVKSSSCKGAHPKRGQEGESYRIWIAEEQESKKRRSKEHE